MRGIHLNSRSVATQTDKTIVPLQVVLGDELLLVMEAADQIRTHAKAQGYLEREIFTVEQRFEWEELFRWTQQSSLFGERRILDLRIPTGKPGGEGGAAIEQLCHALPRDTVIIVTLPTIDKRGRASKWFKALADAGKLTEIKSIRRDQLPFWIKQRLALQQQTVDQETLQFLADKVEGNLLAAHQEISKLRLLYPSGQLTFEQIRLAVWDVTRFDVLQLAEAMLAADKVRYSRILEGLQGEGVAPQLILAILSEQMRLLLKIHFAKNNRKGMSLEQAMTALHIWPSRQRLVASAFQRISYERLVQALLQAAAIDRMIKGVAAGNIWEELLSLGMCFVRNGNCVKLATSNNFLSTVNYQKQ